jgi:acetyl esterase/lipase
LVDLFIGPISLYSPRMHRIILTTCFCLTVAALAADPVELRLWDGTAPGSEGAESVKETSQERGSAKAPNRKISGVTVPTITVYRPAPAANTGTAIVICPGGGYGGLAIDKEGHDIARWLNSVGVTGIVLKYRLPRPPGFIFHHDIPLKDAARALRVARLRAKDWGLKPDRIGIMGFSAGGHLASTLATHFDAGDSKAADSADRLSSRPDFQVLVYPVVSFKAEVGHSGSRKNLIGKAPTPELVELYCNELQVTPKTPPAFLVHTADDGVKVENSLLYFTALRANKVAAELHIYEIGGHGYGILPTDKPVATWHHRLADWMKQRGLR